MSRAIDNFAMLKKAKTFDEVHESPYFREHFVKRYINDIPRMAYEVFNTKLTWQQIEILEAHDWEGGRVAVPSGHGCHGIGTPIMMADGQIKNVEFVRVGDLVMGDDGVSPRKVLKLHRGRQEMYEFEYENGVKRVYNKSHILHLYSHEVISDIDITVDEFLKRTEAFTDDEYFCDFSMYVRNIQSGEVKETKVVEAIPLGADDYYGFEIDGNNLFLDGDGLVQHNSGKTKLIGIIAAAHLLLFKKSITRIQAPKEDQVTKFSFKEIATSLAALTMPRKIGGKTKLSKWAFLYKFIQINTTKIYIKKFPTEWYIEPATAPKGDPNNLSGQHNWSYLLIFDEASGIPDTHINGSLGALTDKYNSCIMFSQHTRTSGKFHDFVTTQSVDMGGVWEVVRINSEESPRVTDAAIAAWRATYTENEYNVRVLGLQPEYEDGYLLTHKEAMAAYTEPPWYKDFKPSYRVGSTDVAFTGFRDSSVTTGMDIQVRRDNKGNLVLFVAITDIDVFLGRNRKLPTEMAKITWANSLQWRDKHPRASVKHLLAIDANTGGYEAYTELRGYAEKSGLPDVIAHGIMWGIKRMSGMDKRRFFNQRAKANVLMQEAFKAGRVYIKTKKHQMRVLRELSHLPFTFTADLKYKMLSKEEMAKQNLSSPDIADTFAQPFLLTYDEGSPMEEPTDGTGTEEADEGIADSLGEVLEEVPEDDIDIDDPLGDIDDLEGTTIM